MGGDAGLFHHCGCRERVRHARYEWQWHTRLCPTIREHARNQRWPLLAGEGGRAAESPEPVAGCRNERRLYGRDLQTADPPTMDISTGFSWSRARLLQVEPTTM